MNRREANALPHAKNEIDIVVIAVDDLASVRLHEGAVYDRRQNAWARREVEDRGLVQR